MIIELELPVLKWKKKEHKQEHPKADTGNQYQLVPVIFRNRMLDCQGELV